MSAYPLIGGPSDGAVYANSGTQLPILLAPDGTKARASSKPEGKYWRSSERGQVVYVWHGGTP